MKEKKKVFCIGLSRTGTSSLTSALMQLGYKAKHFPEDILKHDSEKLLLKPENVRKYDAISDTPVAKFYKQLDSAYPNSKFILTVREINSWLNSCEKYFLTYPSAEVKRILIQIRLAVYKTADFDRKKFKDAYNKHINDVLTYFKGREQDLLIINICAGDGWDKVCHFLNVKIPSSPFPKLSRPL